MLFSRLVRFTLPLVIAFTTTGGARADFEPEPPPPPSAEKRAAIQDANAEMLGQMRAVARYLQSYCTMNYRFPVGTEEASPDEPGFVARQLNLIAPDNPYRPSAAMSAGGVIGTSGTTGSEYQYQYDLPRTQSRFRFKLDYGLTKYVIQEWAQRAPDDWQAAPGTITAISNNANTFVVWGAGYDGRPIKNGLTGGTALIAGHWYGSQHFDSSSDSFSDSISE